MSAEPKRLSDDPEVPEDVRQALEIEARQAPSYDVNHGWERLTTEAAARLVGQATPQPAGPPSLTLGRYTLYGEIGAGGMATVHYARMEGAAGFGRTVAVKRLHPQLAKDTEFVAMFLDEASLAARVRHPNVVQTLDVVAEADELFVVMEYVHGEPLSKLIRVAAARGERVPPRIVASIMTGVLHGLHAAHEAKSETGGALNIVHRDVSPQNILVGADGVARVLDFGVAKAVGRLHTTRDGQIKGKLAYMPPEQLSGGPLTRQADVYAAAVVYWEALTRQRLFMGETEVATIARIVHGTVAPPSSIVPDVSPAVDRIVLRGLSRELSERFATARDMALALERETEIAPASEVAAWVERVASKELHERSELVSAIEREGSGRKGAKRVLTDIATPARSGATSAVDVEPASLPKQERRSPSPYVFVGAAALAAIAVAYAYTLDGRTPPVPDSMPNAPSAVVASAIGEAPSASASVPTPVASASAPPQPSASVATSARWTPPRPSIPKSAAPSATASSTAPPIANPCDPPYTTDANGHRHYKPNCFTQ